METSRTEQPPGSARLGKTVGKYRLHAILGTGGMSTVYAATHRNGFAVAIKMLHAHLASDEAMCRWFRREGKLANIVNHPGAVRVHDDDVTEDGVPYLVVERLYGEALRAIWERAGKKLPAKEVAVFAYDALDILAAAHARGLVHRDVKPDNLYLTDDGLLKLLDFGIAHPLPIIGQGAAMATMRIAGTPAFMAPEQARGIDVRAETDIWGVGATMFALIAGEHVHAKAPPPDLLLWASTRPARSIGEVAQDLPMQLATVMDRALAFEPTDRFPTAGAMRVAVAEAYAAAFGEELADARDGVVVRLRSRIPGTARARVEASNVHSVRTLAPPRSGLTEMRGAVTRTHPYLDPEPKRSWRIVSYGAAAATGCALVAVGLRACLLPASPFHSGATPGANLSSSATQPSEMLRAGAGAQAPPAGATDFGTYAGTAPEAALQHYRAGTQLWRDDSIGGALAAFSEAASEAPSFAPAHLRIVLLSSFMRTSTRVHFEEAQKFRSMLNQRDAALLDALEPAIAEPPDWNEVIQRLERLRAHSPADRDLPLLIARRLMLINESSRALVAADEALRLEPDSAVGWGVRANALVALDSLDDARKSFARCLELSPSSTSCFQMLLQLEGNEGNCDEVERLSRQLIAKVPNSPEGYEFLAGAIFSSTRSVSAARAALEQRWVRIPEKDRALLRFRDEFSLAILGGKFDDAQHVLDAWESSIASEPGAAEHGNVAYRRIQLSLLGGNDSQAVELANKYLALSTAWAPDELYDFRMAAHRVLYIGGATDAATFRRWREEWLRNSGEASTFMTIPAFRWVEAFAGAVRTRADALDALAQLPKEHPFLLATLRDAEMDRLAGVTFLAADNLKEAVVHLSRAANSCSISEPVGQVRAFVSLGDARVRLHDHRGACEAYGHVLRLWKSEKSSVDARYADTQVSKLHCSMN